MTHKLGVAVDGVEGSGSAGQSLQLALELLEGADALLDLSSALPEEIGDVRAGRLATVS